MRADDLPRHLAQGVAPLYVIHGDEPLLALEAGDAVRAAARAAGCEERETLVAEQHFKWDAFLAADASMGLFGGRKLIDLRIPSGKPGVEGARALETYAGNPNPDNVTLITLPRLDRATQASAWFAALDRTAVTITVQPVDRAELPCWIAARLARQQQEASPATLEFLADLCEGNLLAARQEIDKLGLLLPAGELAQEDVEQAVSDVARFDVFALSQAWLEGDAARALRILAILQQEGEPLTLVVWQLSEDVHAIAAVHQAMRTGASAATAIRESRVWGKRQAAMEAAVKRLTARDVQTLLTMLAPLDGLAKGLGHNDPWDAVARATLAMTGRPFGAARGAR
jgi:DNA polymerase-3 subunit delta